MSSPAVELALKKQRLQFASERLRSEFALHSRGIRPVCNGVDAANDALRWVRVHPHVAVAVGTALVVSRPERLWRWARRVYFGWQAWRRLRNYLDSVPVTR